MNTQTWNNVSQNLRTFGKWLQRKLCRHGPLMAIRRVGFKPSVIFVCVSCHKTFWPKVSA